MKTIEVLILVKAYPNPSKKYIEAACVAGIDRNSRWIRLYPVPFRQLEDEQKFKKYQWIRVRVKKARNDLRPESYWADSDSIEPISDVLSTDSWWKQRREIIDPLVGNTMCGLQRRQKEVAISLGIIKPRQVLDFNWEEEGEAWSPEEQSCLIQTNLFSDKQHKPLERIPYTFRYQYYCIDNECAGHHQKIVDWELAQMYRKLRSTSKVKRLQKVKDKWFKNLCSAEKDTHFFVGNMLRYPGNFLVLGVFYPPINKQMPLF